MFGSRLYVDSNGFKSHWYCKKSLHDHAVWINEEYFVPPLINCLAEYLSSEWDPVNKRITNRTNVQVHVDFFGDEKSIAYVDTGVLWHHFIPDMANVFKRLHKEGYVNKKNLFAAPYDWRLNPHAMDYFYPKLRELIENAYNLNGQQKVAIFSYSAGGLATYTFLTKFVDQEWKDKYIDRVVFGDASIGGSMEAFEVMYTQEFSILPKLYQTESFKKFLHSTPTLFSHLPSSKINTEPVIYGPNGQKFYASEVPELMVKLGKLPEEYVPILYAANPVINMDFPDPGVNSYFIYNCPLNTLKAVQIDDWSTNKYTPIYSKGDGTIIEDALKFGCSKWKSENHATVCHDLNIADDKYSHLYLLTKPEFIELAISTINENDWIVKGTHNITGPTKSTWNNIK